MDSDATSKPEKSDVNREKNSRSTLGYNVYIEGEQQLEGENESWIVKNDRDKKQIY